MEISNQYACVVNLIRLCNEEESLSVHGERGVDADPLFEDDADVAPAWRIIFSFSRGRSVSVLNTNLASLDQSMTYDRFPIWFPASSGTPALGEDIVGPQRLFNFAPYK